MLAVEAATEEQAQVEVQELDLVEDTGLVVERSSSAAEELVAEELEASAEELVQELEPVEELVQELALV